MGANNNEAFVSQIGSMEYNKCSLFLHALLFFHSVIILKLEAGPQGIKMLQRQ